MASPFPAAVSESTTRRIRPGSVLKDFRKEHPDGKILPKEGERNVLVTSALPYVNNQPHLGNIIGSTLSADVFSRYARQRNNRVLYICGTDEYGTTTEVMAAKENVGPKELCDKYHALHAEAYKWFEIGFDHFGRTSTPQQTEICQHIFLKLYENGHLKEVENQQLYCPKDERFLADRYVEGTCPKCGYDGARGDQCENCSATYESPLELLKPRCSACSSTPIAKTTAHLHIQLQEMQPTIEKWVAEASSKGEWTHNGKAFTMGWLREGLRGRGMTRDLKWGVPLPKELGDKWEKKVMYVWFDAPIGYPSITACYTDNWKQWWQNPENVTLFQFMGKDNVPFHTVLFPAYLLGTNEPWTMLDSISTTEYLQYEGTKFSKSKNVGVFGQNARETGVPPSVWRYYLLSNRPETNDSEFTWDDFVTKANSELLNNLGNFVNRMIKFAIAKYDGIIPNPTKEAFDETKAYQPKTEKAKAFIKDVDAYLAEFISVMDHQKIRRGLEIVMAISGRGNQFIQDVGVNNQLLEEQPEECAEAVLIVLNITYILAALIHPFMPSTSDNILAQLDATPRSIPDTFSVDLFPGHKLGKAAHLFSRIDPKNVDVWRAQYGGAQAEIAKTEKEAKSSKRAADKAKKAAAKAATPAQTGPKTDEQIALEEKIKDQGDVVRRVKGGDKKEGEDLAEELSKLQQLKTDLAALTAQLAETTL